MANTHFSVEEELEIDLTAEVVRLAAKAITKRHTQFVDPRNILTFSHGADWSGYTKDGGPTSKKWKGELKKHSAEVEILTERILTADLSAIAEFQNSMIAKMTANFERSVFETLHEATASQQAIHLDLKGDIRPGLIEMWESISLGLKEDLSLNTASIALDSATYQKLTQKLQELESTDPQFIEKINSIKQRKYREALIAYLENLLNFKLHEHERGNIEHQLRQLREANTTPLHEE